MEDVGSHNHEAMLERSGRILQLGEMAAGLAHEINQPLAALIYLLTGASLRAQEGNLNNAQMLEVLRSAIAQAHRAAGIVNLIRDRVLLNGEINRHRLQINALVQDVVELATPYADVADVRLCQELAPSLPVVRVDMLQIQQVLLNLVRNGIEAVRESSARRRMVLVSTARRDEDLIEVRVEDSGDGISAERLPRLFDPFYSTKPKGMGLGLSICKTIVEEHGGHIDAGNRSEGGARFSFTLPVAN